MQVLNLLVYKLTKQPYNELLLEFLFVDEHLVDIGDDLVDYEVSLLCCAVLCCAVLCVPKQMPVAVEGVTCARIVFRAFHMQMAADRPL